MVSRNHLQKKYLKWIRNTGPQLQQEKKKSTDCMDASHDRKMVYASTQMQNQDTWRICSCASVSDNEHVSMTTFSWLGVNQFGIGEMERSQISVISWVYWTCFIAQDTVSCRRKLLHHMHKSSILWVSGKGSSHLSGYLDTQCVLCAEHVHTDHSPEPEQEEGRMHVWSTSPHVAGE